MGSLCLSKQKELWNKTLPVLSYPFQGESLIGYVLRLEHLNGVTSGRLLSDLLPAGSKINMGVTHELEEKELLIDISLLSTLSNISEDRLINMRMIEILKRLHKSPFYNNNLYEVSLLDLFSFKICPLCLKEWVIPIVYFFHEIDTCAKHKTKLISHCLCGAGINIFSKRDPFKCKRKNCTYSDTDVIEFVKEDNLDNQIFIQSLYNKYISYNMSLNISNQKFENDFIESVRILYKYIDYAINSIKKILLQHYKDENIIIINAFPIKIESFSVIFKLLNRLNLSVEEFLHFRKFRDATLNFSFSNLEIYLGNRLFLINESIDKLSIINLISLSAREIIMSNVLGSFGYDTSKCNNKSDRVRISGNIIVDSKNVHLVLQFELHTYTPYLNDKVRNCNLTIE